MSKASPGLRAGLERWHLPDPDGVGSDMGAMSGPTVACNWLVPGRVIVGGYPAAPGNDSAHDEHLGLLLDGTLASHAYAGFRVSLTEGIAGASGRAAICNAECRGTT